MRQPIVQVVREICDVAAPVDHPGLVTGAVVAEPGQDIEPIWIDGHPAKLIRQVVAQSSERTVGVDLVDDIANLVVSEGLPDVQAEGVDDLCRQPIVGIVFELVDASAVRIGVTRRSHDRLANLVVDFVVIEFRDRAIRVRDSHQTAVAVIGEGLDPGRRAAAALARHGLALDHATGGVVHVVRHLAVGELDRVDIVGVVEISPDDAIGRLPGRDIFVQRSGVLVQIDPDLDPVVVGVVVELVDVSFGVDDRPQIVATGEVEEVGGTPQGVLDEGPVAERIASELGAVPLRVRFGRQVGGEPT